MGRQFDEAVFAFRPAFAAAERNLAVASKCFVGNRFRPPFSDNRPLDTVPQLNITPFAPHCANVVIGTRAKATLAVDKTKQDDSYLSPDAPHYIPSKQQQRFEKLDMSHLLTQPVYSKRELEVQ